MLSLQAARTQTPSSHLNLLFSPFARTQHHLLRAQGSQSTAAANTAAERDPPQRPSTGHFLNADSFLSAGTLWLHLYGELKCAGHCFLVFRLSSAAWLAGTCLTSPRSEPSHLCKLVAQAAVGQCPSRVQSPVWAQLLPPFLLQLFIYLLLFSFLE